MLEEKEGVVAVLKEAMRELGMNEKGRVTLCESGFDYAGLSDWNEPVATGYCPRWAIKLYYPIGGEEKGGPFSFEIVTSEFQTEQEIKNFMVKEIKRQMKS